MRLRDARKNKGLTQVELSEKMQINQCTLSAWENGTHVPPTERRGQLESILGDEIDWASEYEPLDSIEQQAAFRYAKYVAREAGIEHASRLVFCNKDLYGLRKLLKQNGFLHPEYKPVTAIDPLLPIELNPKNKERK